MSINDGRRPIAQDRRMGNGAMLTINPDKVCFILIKAREFDEKVAPSETDPGSNPSDDKDVEVLEDQPGDPTYEELCGAIDSLNADEQLDLVALAWMGRGDFDDFAEARQQAAEIPDKHATSEYLVGMPLLGDYLEDGLEQLGYSCADVELDHL